MPEIPEIVTDAQRLATLGSYRILDTLPEAGFDDVVMLARQVCQTPVALVSFVESNRQWFKAALGTEMCETPIEQSVCAHAIAQNDTLIIPDLTKDGRTAWNRLVTDEPHIRFYAGAILRSLDGQPLGTLCVIDLEPRPQGLTSEQVAGLEALSRQVMVLLELRRAASEAEGTIAQQQTEQDALERRQAASERLIARLHDNERRLRMAQEAGQIGTFEIDIATNQIRPSEQFCIIFGLPVSRLIPASAAERMVHPDDAAIVSNESARALGQLAPTIEYRIKRPDGTVVWISRRGELVRDPRGQPVRMIGVVQDITQRKQADDRQQVLNHELSHRLKNTLTMVQAIATQTMRGASDKEAVKAFNRRVTALSRAHDILLQTSWSSADLRNVLTAVMELHADAGRFFVAGPDVRLGDKAALSLSLLVHELATNAVKYGSLSMPGGGVETTWRIDGSDLVLSWREFGGPAAQEPERGGFGTRLIKLGIAGTGQAELAYTSTGFSAVFRAPLSLIVDR
ncbi:sensor histidine kinase [Rhodoplanes sp. Z2-YC6860]|uniref:sensor histidine kinase n=1 Tax=Rhodoplanes sp. Z2-YC6860 TaxID=674703 RepID=UPI00078D4581|nr:HWE histidine kinase domain-containing protein [Rhodoplanes sp. Z2-YC6860]AMN43149.1 signal transduction histidine kinase [Rhodoplanes sp. Z2-YC6860]